jgi:hypothetical protein
MNDTIIITSIYSNTVQTGKMMKSCKDAGVPVHNAFRGRRFTGNGDVIRYVYEALLYFKNKYKYAIYSDGGDTYITRKFTPPDNIVVYSAEKACYPHPSMAEKYPVPRTVWRFLNGGNYCGPIPLLIEFFEKYGLSKFKGDINGQHEQMIAYLKALEDGFPIILDEECVYFQTIAFAEPTDFSITEQGIRNNITNTHPYIFHGNGRTPMDWIYDYYGTRST